MPVPQATRLGATSAAKPGFRPNMLDPVWGGFENLNRFGSAKTLACILKYSDLGFLAREHVRYKNHSTLMTRYKDAAMGNFFNYHFKGAADPGFSLVHLLSVPESRRD